MASSYTSSDCGKAQISIKSTNAFLTQSSLQLNIQQKVSSGMEWTTWKKKPQQHTVRQQEHHTSKVTGISMEIETRDDMRSILNSIVRQRYGQVVFEAVRGRMQGRRHRRKNRVDLFNFGINQRHPVT